jgi:glycosyltransferase involved in cell wall biosynthesis
MRILFATSHPYPPQIAGGAQSTAHELAQELQSRRHVVAVHSGLLKTGWLGVRDRVILKTVPHKAAIDEKLGYRVYRSWRPWEAALEVKTHFCPDVVVAQSGHCVRMAKAYQNAGANIAVYLHNVEFDTDLAGDPRELGPIPYIANSQFTALEYKEHFGLDPVVIYPLIKRAAYRTQSDGSSVVFINPHPDKGLELATRLAAQCPEIPFLFVEAWTLGKKEKARLQATLKGFPNVTLLPRTQDMLAIYRKAKIILAPSRYQETFGRVAAEAHLSGIPVLASRRGGLPEAVGPGGVVLDYDAPIDDWAAALRNLWAGGALYEDKAEAARNYSLRSELDPDMQVVRFLQVMEMARKAMKRATLARTLQC